MTKKSKPKIIFIYTTVPSLKTAERLAEILLKDQLIACANIFPKISSQYILKGKIEKSIEIPMILKTSEKLFNQVQKIIDGNHPYDCPCILSWSIAKGNKNYINWMNEVMKPTYKKTKK